MPIKKKKKLDARFSIDTPTINDEQPPRKRPKRTKLNVIEKHENYSVFPINHCYYMHIKHSCHQHTQFCFQKCAPEKSRTKRNENAGSVNRVHTSVHIAPMVRLFRRTMARTCSGVNGSSL